MHLFLLEQRRLTGHESELPHMTQKGRDQGLRGGATRVGAGAPTTRGGDVPSPGTTAPVPTMSAKRRSAMIWLAASEVWYASQNTKSLRSAQSCAVGRHRPPTVVSTSQHDVCDVLNPARRLLMTLHVSLKRGERWHGEVYLPYFWGWSMSSMTME